MGKENGMLSVRLGEVSRKRAQTRLLRIITITIIAFMAILLLIASQPQYTAIIKEWTF
jgi:capsular polysaccharide biosynthesis protein